MTHRAIPIGSTVTIIKSEQPARPDDPWSTIAWPDPPRTREGSLALVLGNRVDDVLTRSAGWSCRHDTLCLHDVYGLCWLPSESMNVVPW